MKGSQVIARFAINSAKESKANFQAIAKKIQKGNNGLTFRGEGVILTNGKSGPIRKESSIEFKETYASVFDIETCNDAFITAWENHLSTLQEIISGYEVELILDYEITVFNAHNPSLFFSKEFISFLGKINCDLSFYFYEG